jgi:hypothetical protein
MKSDQELPPIFPPAGVPEYYTTLEGAGLTLVDPKTQMYRMFKEIGIATADAIREAKEKKVDDGVNWGDIRCTRIAHCEAGDGEIWYQVSCEEAAPDAYRFQIFVADFIYNRLGVEVDVVTEW